MNAAHRAGPQASPSEALFLAVLARDARPGCESALAAIDDARKAQSGSSSWHCSCPFACTTSATLSASSPPPRIETSISAGQRMLDPRWHLSTQPWHQIFRKYETYSIPALAVLLLIPPALIIAFSAPPESTPGGALVLIYSSYLATLLSSIAIYRLSPFHPFARYPRPGQPRTGVHAPPQRRAQLLPPGRVLVPERSGSSLPPTSPPPRASLEKEKEKKGGALGFRASRACELEMRLVLCALLRRFTFTSELGMGL
ncbi:hypothetical protein C8Q76DRAFT_801018 [Earliella scabrosa]|nr:hypothetical protein C8Q76DRAFT_801018 [Earliella scabrosa]